MSKDVSKLLGKYLSIDESISTLEKQTITSKELALKELNSIKNEIIKYREQIRKSIYNKFSKHIHGCEMDIFYRDSSVGELKVYFDCNYNLSYRTERNYIKIQFNPFSYTIYKDSTTREHIILCEEILAYAKKLLEKYKIL